MKETIIDEIKQIIHLIQQENDIEEIEYDDKATQVHIKVRRRIPQPKNTA